MYVNDDPDIRSDPLIDSIENLMTFIDKATNKEKQSDDWDDIRPMKVKEILSPFDFQIIKTTRLGFRQTTATIPRIEEMRKTQTTQHC